MMITVRSSFISRHSTSQIVIEHHTKLINNGDMLSFTELEIIISIGDKVKVKTAFV